MPLVKALINGQPTQSLDIEDRALHYGDGLFETMLMTKRKIDLWPEHFNRLAKGCQSLNLAVPTQQQLAADIQLLSQDLAPTDYLVKLIVSRGSAGRGLFVDKKVTPTLIWLVYDYQPAQKQGKRLFVCKTTLSENANLAGIKHLNRLNYVLAAEELSTDYDEGIVVNSRNEWIECIQHNLFFVAAGELHTSAISDCGVAGVQRARVMRMAKQLGIKVNISSITYADALKMDECFITNAVVGLQSVSSINDIQYEQNTMMQRLSQSLGVERTDD